MPVPKRFARMAAANQNLKQVQDKLRVTRTELRTLQSRVGDLRSQFGDLVDESDHAQLIRSTLRAQIAALAHLDQITAAMQRDALTDTPSRALLLDSLQSALALARRRGTGAAVIFLDVDHFKQINDTLGHACGDAVLQMVARRVQAAIRDSDAVGRRGGDEFLVLLAQVSKVTDVAQIAQKIIDDVAQPHLIGKQMVRISVSAGIALFPVDGIEAADLIDLADAAMYESKRRGGSCFSFHSDPTIDTGWAELPE
jgi:diguanylate cyclase (GGDEF)-like protein